MSYAFRPVGAGDLPLLNAWVARPHVACWWGEGEVFDAEYLADPQAALWIVALDGRDFAFAQDYAVHGFGPHHFDYLPAGARGIDQFIGEADLMNRGHGGALVRRQLDRLFSGGAPVVGADPHPDNSRAIAAYRKAGFRDTGVVRETPWGRSLLMECWRVDRAEPST